MRLAARRKQWSRWAAIVGMATLCYVGGAGVMFYALPSSGWMTSAFLGARAWRESEKAAPPTSQPPPKAPALAPGDVDQPSKTCDGFTLFTCAADKDLGTQAFLVNMQREVVHHWSIQVSDIPPADSKQAEADPSTCFFSTYLYPNGDLLAVCASYKPGSGGLLRLDAASNLVWFCPRAIHHDVDVAEDGTIYAVEDEVCYDRPSCLEGVALPYVGDSLLALSPEGKLLREPIRILSGFCDSPYEALLATLEEPETNHQPPAGSTAPQVTRLKTLRGMNDATHTNCVRVLSAELAEKFPAFQAGQVLLSLRSPSLIAVLEPLSGRVVWAARGPWLAQHDPQFLDNGHLLIFDNLGSPLGSRVLEYSPQTQAVPWAYSGSTDSRIYTSERGMNQRLPNGNTFIVVSEAGKMIEVNAEGDVVWSYSLDRFICSARRYLPEQLEFLDPAVLARPGSHPGVAAATTKTRPIPP